MYKIIEGNGITQLMTGEKAMVCPYKTAHPMIVPEKSHKGITVAKQEMQMVFKGYINQPCDSTCPLFQVIKKEGSTVVVIHCGCEPVAFEVS